MSLAFVKDEGEAFSKRVSFCSDCILGDWCSE